MVQKWTCNGVSKDGQQHSNQFSPGSHEPQENYGDDCVMCGLTREQVVGSSSKPSGKLIAIPVVASIVAALGVGSWVMLGGSKTGTIIPTPPPPESPVASPETTVPPATTASRCGTDKFVKKSGSLFGAIEVGSRGIKGNVVQQLESPDIDGSKLVLYRKEKIEPRNVEPIDPNNKSKTLDSVREMFMEMQSRFNIPCEQIVMYFSSGMADYKQTIADLTPEIQQVTGRTIGTITAEDEAKFAFDGVVPEWRRNEGVSIDIGSGNTKGTFLNSDNQHVPFSIPFGTSTFTKEVKRTQRKPGFQEAAEDAKKELLTPLIMDVIQRKPGMRDVKKVYLAGGISWALSTLGRPCSMPYTIEEKGKGRFDSFFPLRSEDIATFYNNATQAPKALFEPNLSECSDKRREEVQAEIAKVRKVFKNNEDLIAGAEILRAFDKELDFSGKEVYFASSMIDALPRGYIKQQLANIEKDGGRTSR